MIQRIKNFLRTFSRLPDKKKYFELITAVLSIPVLLSVILLNYTNLQNQRGNNDNSNTDTPTPAVITIIQDRGNNSGTPKNDTNNNGTNNSISECIPEVGPVTITSPEAGESTNANPLSIIINQNDPKDEYCAVVWSYRLNSGPWSNFDDKDIYIYNLDSGQKKLDVRIKSLISGDEETISRTFSYQNTQQVATPTQTPTATNEPTPTITPTEEPDNEL